VIGSGLYSVQEEHASGCSVKHRLHKARLIDWRLAKNVAKCHTVVVVANHETPWHLQAIKQLAQVHIGLTLAVVHEITHDDAKGSVRMVRIDVRNGATQAVAGIQTF
jgi:hypothetical protein